MSKSMMGAAGGGKVTVEGLSADVVLAGTTVTVKQGAKVVQQVIGAVLSEFELIQQGGTRSTCTFSKAYRQVVAYCDDTQPNDGSYITVTWALASGTNKSFYNGGSAAGKAAVAVYAAYGVKAGDSVTFYGKWNNGRSIVIGVPE